VLVEAGDGQTNELEKKKRRKEKRKKGAKELHCCSRTLLLRKGGEYIGGMRELVM